MKIRNGFVSNSSSSSFLIIGDNEDRRNIKDNYFYPLNINPRLRKKILKDAYRRIDRRIKSGYPFEEDEGDLKILKTALKSPELPVYMTSRISDSQDVYYDIDNLTNSVEYEIEYEYADELMYNGVVIEVPKSVLEESINLELLTPEQQSKLIKYYNSCVPEAYKLEE